jgi:chaperonin GroEL
MKEILYGKAVREKFQMGIQKLADAVCTTLGPRGSNVCIGKSWGSPQVVHDGVTVAKEVMLEDPFENMGAQLVREAASKTNDVAGDGTTTATLLASEIIKEGIKSIDAGCNPMMFRQGIEKACDAVVSEIDRVSTKVSGKKEVLQVATLSAQSPVIGEVVAAAIEKVGKSGFIEIEESSGFGLEIAHTEGMSFDKGYVSPYFVTDAGRMEAVLDDVYVLLTSYRFYSITDLLHLQPVVETVMKEGKGLVIVAEDFSDEVISMLLLNKHQRGFQVVAVRAPGFAERKRELMEDASSVVGGNIISNETGRKLDSVVIEDLGVVDRVVVTGEETKFLKNTPDKARLASRIEDLKAKLSLAKGDYEKEALKERLGKLTGGVAIIKVGGLSEVEIIEKKLRVEDAVHATRAAVAEGIVPGGGVTLLRATQVIDALKLSDEERSGAEILKKALRKPIEKLLLNAGLDAGGLLLEAKATPTLSIDNVIDTIEVATGSNMGFNVLTMQHEDLIVSGIIDPAKVVKSALRNAVSVASVVLTTNCAIVEKEEKKDD